MKPLAEKRGYTPFKARTTLMLLALVLVLALSPVVLRKNAAFTGTDDQAQAAITALAPDYTPWMGPLWEPPSSEIESLIFSVQAALGAGVLGYLLGHWKGRKQKADE